MSLTARGIDAYRKTEAQSASPLELVVMLYDGALRFLAEAREAHARRDFVARAHALRRVSAIVAQCQATLDLEKGGAVAAELDRLYVYVSTRLLDITVKKDAAAIDEIHRLLSTVRDGWAQASAQAPPPPAPAPPAIAR